MTHRTTSNGTVLALVPDPTPEPSAPPPALTPARRAALAYVHSSVGPGPIRDLLIDRIPSVPNDPTTLDDLLVHVIIRAIQEGASAHPVLVNTTCALAVRAGIEPTTPTGPAPAPPQRYA